MDKPIVPIQYFTIENIVGKHILLNCCFNFDDCRGFQKTDGLIIHPTSASSLADVYRGKIDVVAVNRCDTVQFFSGIEHYSQRISAWFWCFVGEYGDEIWQK